MNENDRTALLDSLELAAKEMEAVTTVYSVGSIIILALCAVFCLILFVEIVLFAKRSWLLSLGCFLMLSSIPNLVLILMSSGYNWDIAWVLISSHVGFQSVILFIRWETPKMSNTSKTKLETSDSELAPEKTKQDYDQEEDAC